MVWRVIIWTWVAAAAGLMIVSYGLWQARFANASRDCPECTPECCPGHPGRDCCCRTMDNRCKCNAPHDPSKVLYGG